MTLIKSTPLVSIIMPTFNAEKYIGDAIDSVLKQTYTNFELLITDDCSTDNTVELILSAKEKDSRIHFFQNKKNEGAGFSRNQSISHAKGKYIAFLDSDDLWLSVKLEKQITIMESKGLNFTYTTYQKFNQNKLLGFVVAPDKVTYQSTLKGNKIGCLTVIYNVEELGKRYMPLIRKRQDYALWLEILKDPKVRCQGVIDNLAFYRVDSGMTKNKFSAAFEQWKFYRNHLRLSLIDSLSNFIPYSIQATIKWLK